MTNYLMNKEISIFGTSLILIGIGILIKTKNAMYSSMPIIIGTVLIFFNREENKIEKRKDIK